MPVLRAAYFAFRRPGGYNCAGVDIRRESPVDFWIKLPIPPDELRRLGHDIPNLYPDQQPRWDGPIKVWTVGDSDSRHSPGRRDRDRANKPVSAVQWPDASTGQLAACRAC